MPAYITYERFWMQHTHKRKKKEKKKTRQLKYNFLQFTRLTSIILVPKT